MLRDPPIRGVGPRRVVLRMALGTEGPPRSRPSVSLLLPLALVAALGIVGAIAVLHRRTRALHAIVIDPAFDAQRAAFREAFAGRGLPDEALDAVHAAMATRVAPARLLAPEVRLCTDLGFDPMEVEDIALLVAAELGGHIPTGAELDQFDAAGITLEGLVRFVATCSTMPNGARHAAGRAA